MSGSVSLCVCHTACVCRVVAGLSLSGDDEMGLFLCAPGEQGPGKRWGRRGMGGLRRVKERWRVRCDEDESHETFLFGVLFGNPLKAF